jgi:hypothetical protein
MKAESTFDVEKTADRKIDDRKIRASDHFFVIDLSVGWPVPIEKPEA